MSGEESVSTQALAGAIVHDMPAVFSADGRLDEAAFSQHARSTARRSDFLLVNSHIGEGLSLTFTERRDVVELAVATGGAPVIVDVTSFSTDESLQLACQAQLAGAAAIAVAPPHYWQLGEKDVVQHLRSIAGSVRLPVILASGPGCATQMSPAMIAKLARSTRNVIGAIFRGNGYIAAIEVARLVRSNTRSFAMIMPPSLRVALAHDPCAALVTCAGSIEPALVLQAGSAILSGDTANNRQLLFRLIELERLIRGDPARLKSASNLVGSPLGKPRLPLRLLEEERSVLYDELARLEIASRPFIS